MTYDLEFDFLPFKIKEMGVASENLMPSRDFFDLIERKKDSLILLRGKILEYSLHVEFLLEDVLKLLLPIEDYDQIKDSMFMEKWMKFRDISLNNFDYEPSFFNSHELRRSLHYVIDVRNIFAHRDLSFSRVTGNLWIDGSVLGGEINEELSQDFLNRFKQNIINSDTGLNRLITYFSD